MQQFYMDGFLKKNLDIAKDIIKKDWDMIIAVDGAEGSGKSVLAQQMAYYCDNSLILDRIVFTPYTFRKAIVEAKPYQAVVYDEAYTGLNSRATMSMVNRTLITMLAEIRQKNLFVFVVMPCFFDLDKYVSLWRSRALVHVYTGKNFERGFFQFYNSDKKKYLYMMGKKFYSYAKPKSNFYGRFPNHYVVDAEVYRKKKKDSLLDREKKREDFEKKRELELELFERMQSIEVEELTHAMRIKILGMPASTYWVWLRKYNEDKNMLGA